MKVSEAHERLTKLAGKRFCSTQYELVNLPKNSVFSETKCCVYIAGYDSCVASNFVLALEKMEDQLGLARIEEDLEEK